MITGYYKDFSPNLNREVEMKSYGHAGQPILFIPCQDGRYYDFENFKMTDTFRPYIDRGQTIVYSIDTIDLETWSNKNGDPAYRIRLYEAWINYICYEVVPFIMSKHDGQKPKTFGCSLGATHAVNLFLRRPDLFSGCLALSGVYTAEYGFDNYMDELVYQNSPLHYMNNLPSDHYFIDLYNNSKAVICVGLGAYEVPDSTRALERMCKERNINLWFDYWGYDVNHDWPWWYKQVAYFLPYLLGL